MAVLFDARSNEYAGSLDIIGGQTFTDARVSSATLGALNAELLMDIHGKAVAFFEIRSAASNASYVFEGTIDGTNYFTLPARSVVGTIVAAVQSDTIVSVVVSTAAISAVYAISATGWRRVRCRVSAYTSGNAVVTGRATEADYAIIAQPQPSLIIGTFAGLTNVAQTLLAAPAAGLFLYMTSVIVTWHSTAAVVAAAPPLVQINNVGAAGMTSRFASGPGVAVGAGIFVSQMISFPTPVKAFAAATAIQAQLSAAAIAGSSITITMTGYAGA